MIAHNMVVVSDGSLNLYDNSAGNNTPTNGPTWMEGGKFFEMWLGAL